MYDVLIIGAGIEGTAIARRLSRYALSIALVEAANDVAMGSTKANSAIVHGGYAEANAKLKGRVCYKGRVQFAQLDKELNFGFRETGSLVITTNEDDLPKLEALLENGKLNGLDDLLVARHRHGQPQHTGYVPVDLVHVCQSPIPHIHVNKGFIIIPIPLFMETKVTGNTRLLSVTITRYCKV